MFGLLFAAELSLVIREQRTQVFVDTAQKTGSSLIDFAHSRAALLQRQPNEPWEQYEQRVVSENLDAQSQYSKSYASEVARLRDGFARRGLRSPDLDEFYQKPGSLIAVHEVGKALFDLGAVLRTEHFPGELKGLLRRMNHSQ